MFGRIYDYFVAQYRAVSLANELVALSDRNLADIGVMRSEIADLARAHATRSAKEEGIRRAQRAARAALIASHNHDATYGIRG